MSVNEWNVAICESCGDELDGERSWSVCASCYADEVTTSDLGIAAAQREERLSALFPPKARTSRMEGPSRIRTTDGSLVIIL